MVKDTKKPDSMFFSKKNLKKKNEKKTGVKYSVHSRIWRHFT